jgi:hypothetical protein
MELLRLNVKCNYIRQNPQYTIVGLKEGVYMIGMKDQFNKHDLPDHYLHEHVKYVSDEMGFILYSKDDKNGGSDSTKKSVDEFGPYCIENYILLEVLSKQEIAQNVIDYYINYNEQLEKSLSTYNEQQGKGFICWRFLMNEAVKAARAAKKVTGGEK